MASTVASSLTGALQIFILMSLPVLGAAMVVGVLVAVLQAATQIQDQSLPQTLKLMVVVGVFVALSGALVGPLVAYADGVFTNFPAMVR